MSNSLKIKSLSDLKDKHRDTMIRTVENLGLDTLFTVYGCKRTDSAYSIAHRAWELLADGLSEDEGERYLIDEFNHIASRN